MSEYNWCHGPDCHTYETQSRIRGSGDHKVLRTVKIKLTEWNKDHAFKYFCNNNCLFGYLSKHLEEVVKIAPRRKALETPVKVEVKTYDAPDHPYYQGRKYKTITRVDNS